MTLIDAARAFDCRRFGHVPSLQFQPNVFVSAWICPCSRCHRLVQFDMPKPKPLDPGPEVSE